MGVSLRSSMAASLVLVGAVAVQPASAEARPHWGGIKATATLHTG
jgi:hypothetical protein